MLLHTQWLVGKDSPRNNQNGWEILLVDLIDPNLLESTHVTGLFDATKEAVHCCWH